MAAHTDKAAAIGATLELPDDLDVDIQVRKVETPEPSRCPRCTFKNHPSLSSCEMCGASLVTSSAQRAMTTDIADRSDSPGPSLRPGTTPANPTESIKFSFRNGGYQVFNNKLKEALIQRKWLLQSAPPAPRNIYTSTDSSNSPASTSTTPPRQHIGIAGLERRDQELRKNNEVIIGNAFEDLSALMASAKEIVALAEMFAKQTRSSSTLEDTDSSSESDPAALLSQLNLTTTRDMLGSGTGSSSLYLAELSRQLAEFLTDDRRGVLKSEGGIISLVDLWAVFNRARGGVELVSPSDFADATGLFDKLKLPVRLRKFRSGLTVVQGRDRTDEKTIKALLDWLEMLRQVPPLDELGEEKQTAWDWRVWGVGITAVEAAERFGWSVGVAGEELEMAEEKGSLCREEGVEGVRWWRNWLVEDAAGQMA
jgi:ESCRT-II complex subunit VPS36